MFQDLYDRTKKIIKKDACLKFYDASRPLHLESDASGVSLGSQITAGNGRHELWV